MTIKTLLVDIFKSRCPLDFQVQLGSHQLDEQAYSSGEGSKLEMNVKVGRI